MRLIFRISFTKCESRRRERPRTHWGLHHSLLNYGDEIIEMNNRVGAYKKTIDADDSRRRREESSIQIRKEKREARLFKRRTMVKYAFIFFEHLEEMRGCAYFGL